MTDEQEFSLIETVGGLKVNVENYRKDTKKALDLITGNGTPEDGILYIMTDIRRGDKDLKEQSKAHEIVHASINDCITKHDIRLNEIETQTKVAEASRAWSTRFWEWVRGHIKTAVGGGLAILGLTGFSLFKIIKALIVLREIAEKMGVK
jgi:hypothetical protein